MAFPDETIVVIGAGVIGLSAALQIQEQFSLGKISPSIIIIAREFPSDTSINYATPWAGAHYRPCPGNSPQLLQEAVWAKKTYDTFDNWSESGRLVAGVEFMPGEEFFEKPSFEHHEAARNASNSVYAHLASSFEVLSSDELSKLNIHASTNSKLGFRYRSYCVNSPVYASFLQRKFQKRGGRVRQYTLAALEEAFALEANVSAVVNCSGIGFGDAKVFPIRGQTCLVRNPISKTITHQNSDGSWSFAIPRPLEGGTIIGGTKEPHDWNPHPSSEARRTLLSNAAKWFPFEAESSTLVTRKVPGADQFDVVRDIVGRRPAREGGLRLEAEHLRRGLVIHAYGIGGRGVELSWGIADEVVSLLRVQGASSSRSHL
ncbi:hypothetical protein FGRMN_839 [Fusarium graminum]|nr:hypothetical protein FGRMN_839 [Fusarium graminum]